MTSEERKRQFRVNTKRANQKKIDEGWTRILLWVRPEWRSKVVDFVKQLKG